MKPAITIFASSPSQEKLTTPTLPCLISGKASSMARVSRTRSHRPMLVPRSKGVGRSWAEFGEPSSPKVTCIGQVRVRKKRAVKIHPFLFRGIIYRIFRAVVRARKRLAVWRRWRGALGCCRADGYRKHPRKDAVMEPSSFPRREIETDEAAAEQDELKYVWNGKLEVSSTQPKNVPMLMRCRSALQNGDMARFEVSHFSTPAELEREEYVRGTIGLGEDKQYEMMRGAKLRCMELRRSKSEPAWRVGGKDEATEFWDDSGSGDGVMRGWAS